MNIPLKNNRRLPWHKRPRQAFSLTLNHVHHLMLFRDAATREKLYVPCLRMMDFAHLTGRPLARALPTAAQAIDYRAKVIARAESWPIVPQKADSG